MITTDVLFNNKQDTETTTELKQPEIKQNTTDNTFQEVEIIINGEVLENDDKLHNYYAIWDLIKHTWEIVEKERKFNDPDLLDNNRNKLSININTKKDKHNAPSKKRMSLERGGNEFNLTCGVDKKERAKNANGKNEKGDSYYPLYQYRPTSKTKNNKGETVYNYELIVNYQLITSVYINNVCCIASFGKLQIDEKTEEEKTEAIKRSANRKQKHNTKFKKINDYEWTGLIDQSLLLTYWNKEIEIDKNTVYHCKIENRNIIFSINYQNKTWLHFNIGKIISTSKSKKVWYSIKTLTNELELKHNELYAKLLNEGKQIGEIKTIKGIKYCLVNSIKVARLYDLGSEFKHSVVIDLSCSDKSMKFFISLKQYIKKNVLKQRGQEYLPHYQFKGKERKRLSDKIKLILRLNYKLPLSLRDNIVTVLICHYESISLGYGEIMKQLNTMVENPEIFDNFVLNEVGIDISVYK